jgi:hypothetical protein
MPESDAPNSAEAESEGADAPSDSRLGRAVASIAVGSARRPGRVVAVVVLVTLVLGAGLTRVELRSADYDLMPTWHPSYAANAVALDRIPGFRSIETVYFELSPEWKGAQCGQSFDADGWCITDEPSIRALDEAARFITDGTNAKMRGEQAAKGERPIRRSSNPTTTRCTKARALRSRAS